MRRPLSSDRQAAAPAAASAGRQGGAGGVGGEEAGLERVAQASGALLRSPSKGASPRTPIARQSTGVLQLGDGRKVSVTNSKAKDGDDECTALSPTVLFPRER